MVRGGNKHVWMRHEHPRGAPSGKTKLFDGQTGEMAKKEAAKSPEPNYIRIYFFMGCTLTRHPVVTSPSGTLIQLRLSPECKAGSLTVDRTRGQKENHIDVEALVYDPVPTGRPANTHTASLLFLMSLHGLNMTNHLVADMARPNTFGSDVTASD